jgi:hypothetical protein
MRVTANTNPHQKKDRHLYSGYQTLTISTYKHGSHRHPQNLVRLYPHTHHRRAIPSHKNGEDTRPAPHQCRRRQCHNPYNMPLTYGIRY